jgi:hypothetical protein
LVWTLVIALIAIGAMGADRTVQVPAESHFSPDLTASPQEAEAPPQVEAVSVNPVQAVAGEPVTVSVLVANRGTGEAAYSFEVSVDGLAQAPVIGSLPPRGSRTHFLSTVATGQGTHTVAVGDVLTSFIVPPARISVTPLGVSPSLAPAGGTVRLTGRIANDGGVPGSYNIPVFVAGESVLVLEGFLPPRSSEPFLVNLPSPGYGVHTVSVGDRTATFGVLPPIVDVELRDTIQVLPATTVAIDDLGGAPALQGDTVRLQRAGAGVLAVAFPVQLGAGRTLRSFQDPTSGVSYDGASLRVRLPGPRHVPPVTLVADMEPPIGRGGGAVGTARGLRLHIGVAEVNLALAGEGRGIVGTEMEMSLSDITLGTTLSLQPRPGPSVQQRLRLERMARAEGFTVVAVALAMEWNLGGSGAGLSVRATEVEITLDAGWSARFGGAQSIRLAWRDAEGGLGWGPVRLLDAEDGEREIVAGDAPGQIQALTLLAVAPWSPRRIEVPRLVLVPAAPAPGETAMVVASVGNSGPGPAVATLTLQVNGVPQRTRSVTLESGEQAAVEFFASFPTAGNYLIDVDGTRMVLRIAEMLDPLLVLVEELRISPASALVGTPISVSMLVTNLGLARGLAAPRLDVNGVPGATLPVVLSGREQARVDTVLVRARPGRYVVRVGGMESTFVLRDVEAAADFEVSDLAVTPSVVNPGEEATVTFLLRNLGGAGAFQGELLVNDEPMGVGPILVDAYATIPVTATVTRATGGAYRLELGGASATLTVREAFETEFRVTDLRIGADTVSTNVAVSLTVKVTNEQGFVGSGSLTLRSNGAVVETRRLWLGPGVSETVAFTYVQGRPGDYTLDVNGVSAKLVVTRRFPVPLVLGGLIGVIALAATAHIALRRFRAGALPAG